MRAHHQVRKDVAVLKNEGLMSATTPTLMRSDYRGFLLVLAAAIFWSTSGTFIKIIAQRYELSPWTVAVWRDTLTFLGLLIIVLILDAGQLRVVRRDLPRLAAMGAISIGLFHVLWAQALVLIPVAVATVLNYTAPAFVVLMSWTLWQERPTSRQTTALVLTLLGCLLVTQAYDVTQMRLNKLGLLVGLATGVTYGSYTIFGKTALRRYGSWTVVTYAFGFAALTLWMVQPGAAIALFAAPWGAWAWMLVLALVSTVTGFAAYTRGLNYLSANTASIITTLEPVLATALAFALLGEVISPIQMAGGTLVIWGVLLLTQRQKAQ